MTHLQEYDGFKIGENVIFNVETLNKALGRFDKHRFEETIRTMFEYQGRVYVHYKENSQQGYFLSEIEKLCNH